MTTVEVTRDRLDLDASRRFRLVKCERRQRTIAEKSLRHADTADLQRFQHLRLEPAADDELRRAAADVDDKPRLGAGREHVRNADVDQSRLFVPGNNVDGEPERALGTGEKRPGIARDAERIRRDSAHGGRRESGESFGESRQAGKRQPPRLRRQVAAIVEARADAQHLPLRVEPVDLVAFDPSNFEPEAVRAHVDDRQCSGRWRRLHRSLFYTRDARIDGSRSIAVFIPALARRDLEETVE